MLEKILNYFTHTHTHISPCSPFLHYARKTTKENYLYSGGQEMRVLPFPSASGSDLLWPWFFSVILTKYNSNLWPKKFYYEHYEEAFSLKAVFISLWISSRILHCRSPITTKQKNLRTLKEEVNGNTCLSPFSFIWWGNSIFFFFTQKGSSSWSLDPVDLEFDL